MGKGALAAGFAVFVLLGEANTAAARGARRTLRLLRLYAGNRVC